MRRVLLLILTSVLVVTLSSCGVEGKRYSVARYVGEYNSGIYFLLSDKLDETKTHLYKFYEEEFIQVDTFEGFLFTMMSEGKLLGTYYDESTVLLMEYDIDTKILESYVVSNTPSFPRLMSYHDGVAMFYSSGVQAIGDESLILYSTTTKEVILEIDDPSIDMGFGVGDFDQDYVYLVQEQSPNNEIYKGVRIDRATNQIETFESIQQYISYGFDSNQIFYRSVISSNNSLLVSKNDLPTEFFTKYNDYRLRVYFDPASQTFIFSNNQAETIEILEGDTFVSYEVDFNDYSFGYINSEVYYTIDIKEYGSFYKRDVLKIEIKSIETNEVLYTSKNITIATQSVWNKLQ